MSATPLRPIASNLDVATNNNRTNNAGLFGRGAASKSSQIITNIVPAMTGTTPGVLPLPASGVQYYILLATAAIQVRPMLGSSPGSFDTHTQGTGKNFDPDNAFSMLEVRNNNLFPVVFQIFVGWDEYIDRRLILATQSIPQFIYPTYSTTNSATVVNINDQSGQQIADINNNQWYAMYRVAMLFFNPDTGVTYLVQKSGSIIANGLSVGVVYPQTSLRIDAAGNYTVNVGGGNVNAIISEIYAGIPKP